MGTQTPTPAGQPKPTAPGKPSSRQPTEGNVGKDQTDIPADDDDDDEDQTGTIELPGEGGEGDRRDRSNPPSNP